jgi:hypothetical protein
MDIDLTKEIEKPKNITIKEDRDICQIPDYTGHVMYYEDQLTGITCYKFKNDYWYIDEFDTQLAGSIPGKGHGTFFLKYLIRKMYQQKKSQILISAFTGKNPKFPQWLIDRGFEKDNQYFPGKSSTYVLSPENLHILWNRGKV